MCRGTKAVDGCSCRSPFRAPWKNLWIEPAGRLVRRRVAGVPDEPGRTGSKEPGPTLGQLHPSTAFVPRHIASRPHQRDSGREHRERRWKLNSPGAGLGRPRALFRPFAPCPACNDRLRPGAAGHRRAEGVGRCVIAEQGRIALCQGGGDRCSSDRARKGGEEPGADRVLHLGRDGPNVANGTPCQSHAHVDGRR